MIPYSYKVIYVVTWIALIDNLFPYEIFTTNNLWQSSSQLFLDDGTKSNMLMKHLTLGNW